MTYKKTSGKLLRAWVLLVLVVGCTHVEQRRDTSQKDTVLVTTTDSVIRQGNRTTTFSTSKENLAKVLNFQTYSPVRVQYKYTFIDNSGGNKRLTVPGPSDSYLEAVLYFDSLTFQKIRNFDKTADFPSPGLYKEDFQFQWLDNAVREELNRSDSSYHGHPDFLFGKPASGRSWYLDQKIVFRWQTD